MTNEIKSIIEELLKKFNHDREFETDNFLYWINEVYIYNGQKVNREQFKVIKDYTVKNGTLPFIKIKQRLDKLSDEKKHIDDYSKRTRDRRRYTDTNTYCRQRIIRYSKKYKNLEVYDYDIDVRAPERYKSNRLLVLSKRTKWFSINDKNYVLFNGNRWLSLKNWAGFVNRSPGYITPELVKMLMKLMLGGNKWVDDLEIDSINISNGSSRNAESLEKAFENECGGKVPKIIRRALNNDMNDIVKLYNYIKPNQIHYLTNFIKRNHETLNNILKSTSYCNDKPNYLIYLYYLSRDSRLIDKKSTVLDYLRMIENEREKINLNVSSYKTIKAKHDELSNKILQRNRDKRRLKVSKVYPKLSSIPGAMDVELIKSAERLNTESQILNHCVHSYKTSINRGDCAIYSLVHDEERYTLEVRAHKKESENESAEDEYELKVIQLRGKYNCNPPKSMEKYVQMMCDNHELTLPDGKVKFVDKVKEKGAAYTQSPVVREKKPVVKQIGEAILKNVVKELELRAKEDEELPF